MTTVTGGRTKLATGARSSRPPSTTLELEAFRAFPYGLLLLDRRGRVLCSNQEAKRLIDDSGIEATELSCCALFGCRRAGSVLADSCLAELALSHQGTLPEMRVEIATPDGPRAMWLAAGAVANARAGVERIAVQLRPGRAGDRRQRTDTHWMNGPHLRISTLGKTVVESPEGPIGGPWLEQRAGQVLKFLVAARHRSVAVDEIGESVWPGADYAIGASVRYYIHALRRKLEPDRGARAPSAFIAAGCASYRLNLDQVEVDADEFEKCVTKGIARAAVDPQGAASEIERGLALYHGDFLADVPYAEWALAERRHLHELACAGLSRLADIRMDMRHLDSVAGSLEQLATLQPYDEDVHRRLMELDIMRGRRSDAVRRYASLRSRLRRTFGHDPEFTPADLARPRPQSPESPPVA